MGRKVDFTHFHATLGEGFVSEGDGILGVLKRTMGKGDRKFLMFSAETGKLTELGERGRGWAVSLLAYLRTGLGSGFSVRKLDGSMVNSYGKGYVPMPRGRFVASVAFLVTRVSLAVLLGLGLERGASAFLSTGKTDQLG